MRIAIPFTLLLTLPACGLAALDALEADLDARETEGSTTSGGPADTGGSTTSTVTTSPPAGSEGDTLTGGDTDGATSEAGTTSVDPEGPPAITDHELDPATLYFSGALTPMIWAEGADGVRMNLDGAEVELTRNLETDAFEGQIIAYSAFQNGDDYVATFTPWRDDGGVVIEGEALELPYTIAFVHEPGDEDLWDLDKSGGSGQVTAIDILPEGDAVELVTLAGNGTSKCILRRRDSSGVLLDVVDLIPNVKCKGLDLEVDDTGAVYLLLDGWTNAGWMWWLAKAQYFGAPLKSIQTGSVDEVVHALALSASGTMAVCGSTPTPEPEDLSDAVVHIVRPEFSSHAKKFDFDKDGKWHQFDEDARGCAFDPSDENRLIVVGSVLGKQKEWDPEKSNRRFDVVYDVETDHGALRVAPAGLATESVANSVAIDDDGRAWIVGFTSDGMSYEGQIWLLDAEDQPGPAVSLGVHASDALGPNSIRVSPAGYLVIASGGVIGSDPAFSVSAYAPLKAEPLFTFKHEDAGLFHLAHALAIGPYGQIYAGGFGANGYPLFVIIFG